LGEEIEHPAVCMGDPFVIGLRFQAFKDLCVFATEEVCILLLKQFIICSADNKLYRKTKEVAKCLVAAYITKVCVLVKEEV
jgi:hypothetical protein